MVKKKHLLAFKYAAEGVKTLILEETHAKVHIIAAILALGFAWYFDLEKWEWVSILILQL